MVLGDPPHDWSGDRSDDAQADKNLTGTGYGVGGKRLAAGAGEHGPVMSTATEVATGARLCRWLNPAAANSTALSWTSLSLMRLGASLAL